MKYLARKPFRYGNRIYMTNEAVDVVEDDVRMLQGQGKIGGAIPEVATVQPAEKAMLPKPEPKHVGGGWYELEDGSKVRKSELEGR